MFKVKTTGDWSKTKGHLRMLANENYIPNIDSYGRAGVQALSKATPIDTGETASSWDFFYKKTKGGFKITWTNSNMAGNTPVAILIQYGHGTRDGYYVEGIDYINPALEPVFVKMAEDIWKGVTS